MPWLTYRPVAVACKAVLPDEFSVAVYSGGAKVVPASSVGVNWVRASLTVRSRRNRLVNASGFWREPLSVLVDILLYRLPLRP